MKEPKIKMTLDEMLKTKMSLKEQLEWEESIFKETGAMYGLTELKMKTEDPINYEIIWGTLVKMANDALKLGIAITTSPVLRESSDGIFELMTPTGDVVAGSFGLGAHVTLPGLGVKWAIKDGVEDDPGIKHGDMFEQNSALVSSMHPADAYDYVPIIWEGELVGWGAGGSHRPEQGASVPGACVMAPFTYFMEGVQFLFERIGENDRLHREYIRKIQFFTRDPSLFITDTRACMSGALLIRDGVINIIKKYGVDYYKRVTRELIEDGRRISLSKVKQQSVPGRYRKRVQVDTFLKGKPTLREDQNRDQMSLCPIEILIDKTGNTQISLEGASGKLPTAINCGKYTTYGTCSMVYSMVWGYDKLNQGSYSVFQLEPAAEGTWANPPAAPTYPWPACGMSWTFIDMMTMLLFELYGRGFFSRGYIEESMAGGYEVHCSEVQGPNVTGMYKVLLNAENMAGGLPAQPIRDGADVAWSAHNSIVDMGQAEPYEEIVPYVYLGRRMSVDGMGKGKYRGGASFVSVYWFVYGDASHYPLHVTHHGHVLHNFTMYGAYPQGVDVNLVVKGEEILKRIEQRKPLVHGRGGCDKLDVEKAQIPEDAIESNSLFMLPHPISQYSTLDLDSKGSGGFGDPIERDPELVEKDLELGIVTPHGAEIWWAVVANYDEGQRKWKVDYEATTKKRKELIEKRAKRGVPFREWWKREREKVAAKEMGHECLLEMLRQSMQLSGVFDKEVRDFWQLPKDFTF